MWYRYNRRGSRGMRYLWFLFIPLFFIGGHGFFGILLWIGAIIMLSLIGRAVFSAIAASSNAQHQWYQPHYQQPYQQPYQPNQYQNPYQQQEQSYQQGYQQPYYQPRSSHEASQQYDQYEQPRAEYPQELPPMQQ
ncbi:MAG: hypothetical protein PVS3B3_12380 [Ktedonobacteraceae bacterium]